MVTSVDECIPSSDLINNDYFNVNIIPFTWDNTNLSKIKVNDFVNVEIDLLSRYLVNYQKQREN